MKELQNAQEARKNGATMDGENATASDVFIQIFATGTTGNLVTTTPEDARKRKDGVSLYPNPTEKNIALNVLHEEKNCVEIFFI